MHKKSKNRKGKPKLTIRQKRLCDIYHSMKHPNETRAYELAGYKSRGKTAAVEACRTLKKPQCLIYLEELRKKQTEKAEKEADAIITELEKLAFSNIRDFLTFDKNKGVTLKSSSELTEEQLAAIREISSRETKEGRHTKFRLYDKKDALELLGRRFGLFPSRQELTGKEGQPLPPLIVMVKKTKEK